MPTLLAPADVRAQGVETDLLDAALQVLLDDADAEIVRRYGAHTGAITEVLDGGREGLIFLSRPVASITSITERNGLTDTLLAVSDWRSWYASGQTLERLNSGTNAADGWGERVTVVYTPVSDVAIRKRVELDLVKVAIQYNALKSWTVGDVRENTFGMTYQGERDQLLANLSPALGVA